MGKFINPFTQNVVFQRLAEVAEVSKLSKKDRLEYDHALKRYRDTINTITGAEQKGRAEERFANAQSLLANGVPMDTIIKSLKLTTEEVELLSKR